MTSDGVFVLKFIVGSMNTAHQLSSLMYYYQHMQWSEIWISIEWLFKIKFLYRKVTCEITFWLPFWGRANIMCKKQIVFISNGRQYLISHIMYWTNSDNSCWSLKIGPFFFFTVCQATLTLTRINEHFGINSSFPEVICEVTLWRIQRSLLSMSPFGSKFLFNQGKYT